MAADPEVIAEVQGWFSRAWMDLRVGALETGVRPSLNADIVYHAQQAAEKSMKGFLTFHGQVFRKTHNLVEIGESCAQIDNSLEPLLRRAAILTEYAWRFRYPGDPEDPSDEEAASALSLAREVYDALLSRLPRQAIPPDAGSP